MFSWAGFPKCLLCPWPPADTWGCFQATLTCSNLSGVTMKTQHMQLGSLKTFFECWGASRYVFPFTFIHDFKEIRMKEMLVFFTNKINKCNKNIYLISEAQKVHYKMSFTRVSEPIVGKLVREMKYYCQSSFTTPTAWSVLSILCGLTIPVAIGKAQAKSWTSLFSCSGAQNPRTWLSQILWDTFWREKFHLMILGRN